MISRSFPGCFRLSAIFPLACVAAFGCGSEASTTVTRGHTYLAVGPVDAGDFHVELTADSSVSDEIEVDVRLWIGEIVERPPDCSFHWDTTSANPRQGCRITTDSGGAEGWLGIDYRGPEHTTLDLTYPNAEPRLSPPPETRPQIFLFVLDTLRADTFESVLDLRDESQALRSFVADSIFFENARAPASWTRPSTGSILTGLAPQRHGLESDYGMLSPVVATLPEILSAYGYRAYGWSTNPSVLPQWGFAQGFDRFVDVDSSRWESAKPDVSRVLERVERVLSVARGHDELFYIHLIDAHKPYQPGKPLVQAVRDDTRFRNLFPGRRFSRPGIGEAMRLHTHYVAEIIDLNQKLGAFLEHLRSTGAYRNAIIVMVSDHGEEFRDHGRLGHGHTLYEEQLRVPLVVKLPENRRAGERFEQSVEVEDLLPTILRSLDLPIPPGLDGIDVLDSPIPSRRSHMGSLRLKGRNAHSVQKGSWKLIVAGSGDSKLYDLDADPLERTNLAASHQQVLRELQAELENHAARGEAGWHILACGPLGKGSIAFSVRGWPGEIVGHRLETADSIGGLPEREGGPREVRLNVGLTPGKFQLDDDEVVLIPAADGPAPVASIDSHDGTPIPVLLGSGDIVAPLTRLILDPTDESVRIDSLDPPGCFGKDRKPINRPQPTLHVWYVPPAPTLSPETLADPLRERLRALGYLDATNDAGAH